MWSGFQLPCLLVIHYVCAATTNVTTERPVLSEDQIHRELIKCVVHNKLSSVSCEKVVVSQTSENDDIKEGCTRLESFKSLVAILGCTDDDYSNLHTAICTWDGKDSCTNYYQMQRDQIAQNEHDLKPACNKSISRDVKDEDLSVYCSKLTKAKDNLISQKACSSSEIASLEKIVCCEKEMCFEPDINTSTREGRVRLAIRRLSLRCSRTMSVAVDKFSRPPEEACVALESTKPALLGGRICTEQDYENLQKVVCNSDNGACTQGNTGNGCATTTPDPFENEREQRDRIQDVISNQLGDHCQSFMLEQAAAQVSDPLEKTCKTFLDNRGFIVVGEQCTAVEYDTLKLVICGNAGVMVANVVLIVVSSLFVVIKMVS